MLHQCWDKYFEINKDENKINDLPNKIMNTTDTCQSYNIAKIFISSIIFATSTYFNIDIYLHNFILISQKHSSNILLSISI